MIPANAETGPMSFPLQVIIASTRPGRAGAPIGQWSAAQCRHDGRFSVGVTDLAELALPMMDEPNPPRMRQYIHEHTHSWSRTVEAAECFVFVMPEYNHGFCASLKNALDYLHAEWARKAVGFVSYGGVSGGMRAVQLLKPVLTCLRMLPVTDQVALPNFANHLRDGRFEPGADAELACRAMLDELYRTTATLRLAVPTAVA